MNREIDLLLDSPCVMEDRACNRVIENLYRRHNGEKCALIDVLTSGGIYRVQDGVAIIPIFGVLVKSTAGFEDPTGFASTLEIGANLEKALSDKEVSAILFHVDSPGGSVDGTSDLGDAVFQARKKKPIYAYADGMMASGAYWIASQAEKVFAGRTAAVGSIGVYTSMLDMSNLAAKIGIKVHLVKAGSLKGAGMPGTEVTPEQLADRQRIVDGIYELFIAAVGTGRNIPEASVRALADGSISIGAVAQAAGLVDGISSLEAVIQKLKPAARSTGSTRAAQPSTASPQGAKTMTEEEMRAAEKKRAADLKAAFPKDPAFALEAVGEGWTVEQAKAKHHDKLEAELAAKEKEHAEALEKIKTEKKPAGLKPLGGKEEKPAGSGTGASAKTEFDAAVRDRMKADSCDKATAVNKVIAKNGDLHRRLLEEANPGKAELVTARVG